MRKLALALLLMAVPAHAGTLMTYGDSRCFAGFPTSATWPTLVAAQRTDYSQHVQKCTPGRDTSDTASLATALAASSIGAGDVVLIDLTVNDPLNLGDFSAAGSVVRLDTLCGMVDATGATCIIATPLHAPTTRGIVLDHEDYTEAVAELLRVGPWLVIDVREAMTLAEWTACMDVWNLHPGTAACRQDIADYIAPRLP